MRKLILAIAIVGLCLAVPTRALADSGGGPCISPNCYPYSSDCTYHSGGVTYVVADDVWNNVDITQKVSACSHESWNSDDTAGATADGGAVQSYPDTYTNINDVPEGNYESIESDFTFADTYPSGGDAAESDYENAFDVWMGSSTEWSSSGRTEMMIWVNNVNQTPAGTYEQTDTVGAYSYKVYVGSVGGGANIVTYEAVTNTDDSEIDLPQFFADAASNGWLTSSNLNNVYLWQIGFGAEICYTPPPGFGSGGVFQPGLQVALTDFNVSALLNKPRLVKFG